MQAWLRGNLLKNMPMDEMVRAIITASGNTFSNPAGELLPHREGSDRARGDDGATLPRRADAVARSATITHSSDGARTTTTAWPRGFARVKTKPEPQIGGKPGPKGVGAEVVFLARGGEVSPAAHRQADEAALPRRRRTRT